MQYTNWSQQNTWNHQQLWELTICSCIASNSPLCKLAAELYTLNGDSGLSNLFTSVVGCMTDHWILLTSRKNEILLFCGSTTSYVGRSYVLHVQMTHVTNQECMRTGGLSNSVQLCKIRNWSEFTTCTKNSNMHCTAAPKHPLLLSMWPGVLFIVRFNNFDRTTGLYWSYTFLLLLEPPVLMSSWTNEGTQIVVTTIEQQ